MTPWNVEFSELLLELVEVWQQTLIEILNKGIQNGVIRSEVVPKQVAFFVMSGYWGIRNFGKVYNDNKSYHSYLKELKSYLDSLK
jgi:TetR/AcrR family transcriptional repressor of nem operon